MKQRLENLRQSSWWHTHSVYPAPEVGDIIRMKGGKTCRVRRGVRIAIVSWGAIKQTSTGGYTCPTTAGERMAILPDLRSKRKRIYREVSRESEWRADDEAPPVERNLFSAQQFRELLENDRRRGQARARRIADQRAARKAAA